MANHWEESQIEVSNFEAWLSATSPLGSARHAATTNATSNYVLPSAIAQPSPFGSNAMMTTPVGDQDMGTFRDFDVDCSFLQPPDLFISLPIPKDFRPPTYSATPHAATLASPKMQLDLPQFGQLNMENANADMLLFISPKAMTLSQGFGLETPSYNYSKNIPFSGGFENSVMSPMFSQVSKLDMASFDEDFASDKSSQLVMLHHSSSLPQLHSAVTPVASSSSFSLNNDDDVMMQGGNEENVIQYHSGYGRMHRAHSEDSAQAPSRIAEIASSCHHCKRRRHPNELKPCHRNGAKIDRNGAETVAARRTCRKRYCLGCLQKYGISFAEAEQPGWTCMACRGLCECAACRRKGH